MPSETLHSYRLPRGPEISIQRAEPEAAIAVIGLFRAAYRDAYTGHRATRNGKAYIVRPQDAEELFRPDDPKMVKDWQQAFARRTSDDGKYDLLRLVARSKARVLGYAAIMYARTPNAIPCAAENTRHALTAQLREIDVAKAARRSARAPSLGVGTALMHAGVDFLSGIHGSKATLGLTVASENDIAKSWYKRLGFSPTGHHKSVRWPSDKDIHIPLTEMTTTLGDLQTTLADRYTWLTAQPGEKS